MKKPRGRNLDEIIAERRARNRSRLVVALLGLLLLAGAYAVVQRVVDARRNPDFTHRRTVVVPLDNRTGDAAFDTLGLVASDWITRVLSLYSPAHEVVPTTTTLSYHRSAQLGRHDLMERAQRLGRGTQSTIVVWGSFYRTGDSLRFNVEITDLETSLMVGSIPQVAAHVSDPMPAIDKLRSGIVGAILHTESMAHPIARRVPEQRAYQSFVNGLRAHSRADFAAAAISFAAADSDTTLLPSDVWQLESLVRDRQFARADSVSALSRDRRLTRADYARFMRSYSRLRSDIRNVYHWAWDLAHRNPGDDIARYDHALAALAVHHPREARQVFAALTPHQGALQSRPDLYLHHAAAHHLLGNHRSELSVVRAGFMARHRAMPVRLANCRVRAALGDADVAQDALDLLFSPDTDTTGVLSLGDALDDCAAELEAHGLAAVARRARSHGAGWRARRTAAPPIVRDTAFEKGYIAYEQARALAAQGDMGGALNMLMEAIYRGLPYYEPGRVMLHADPAFRKLRNTRGFLRLNQPRG